MTDSTIMSLKFAEIGWLGDSDILYVSVKDKAGHTIDYREYSGADAGGAARARYINAFETVLYKYIGAKIAERGYDPVTGVKEDNNAAN